MVPNADRRRDKVLRLIHVYLTDPGASAALLAEYKDNVCNVIFLTLRAELDAAVERSRRARARAAGRRAIEHPEEKAEKKTEKKADSARHATPERDASRAPSAQPDKPLVVRHRYGVNLRPLTRPNRQTCSKRRFKK